MLNEVRFKIGEIEFEAKGDSDIIERERNEFVSKLLPLAVEAMAKTKSYDKNLFVEQLDIKEIPLSIQDVSSTSNNGCEELERTNLASYINKNGVNCDTDFILFAAYFDEMKNGTKEFSSEEVKKYYIESRNPEPSNISGTILYLAKKGLIMDSPYSPKSKPKKYIISDEGLSHIKNYLPKEKNEKKATKATISSRKRNTTTKSIYSEICTDDLNLNNYPEINAIKNFKEQMMLVMYIVSTENKGDTFSVQDIQYLMTDILGLPATRGQVQGVFDRNVKWFKDEDDPNNPKSVKHKVLVGGKEYVKKFIEEHTK